MSAAPTSGGLHPPEASADHGGVWRFDPFELRADERVLLQHGQHVKVGARAFDLLVALVERRDRVVPKSELLDVVWPRLVVEENNLQVHVLALRKLLGPQAIATVPGRGYRFTAPTEPRPESLAASASPPVPMPAGPVAAGRAAGEGDVPRHASAGDAALPRLIGRETDLLALGEMVDAHRLVTLLGAGGVGKSSLARQLAHDIAARFDDGTAWVDLTPVGEAGGVVDAIAAATRATLARGDRHKALASALAPLRLLLVLDNAEHLLEEVAATAKALHQGAGGVHLVVTSQAPLRLGAEQLFRLEPLALPDPEAGVTEAADSAAVRLFVERVRASDRHFALDSHNAAAVVSLTRRLDGLPLAIEMAAARVPALSVQQLDAALRERFRVLSGRDTGLPPRQQTLQAALRWTHGLLPGPEQRLFRRLAVFIGGFSLPAAQSVCSDAELDEWGVLDALVTLVDRSLVTPPLGEPPRYRLLDTPHAFARQLLADGGEEPELRRRHARWARAFFEAANERHLRATLSTDAWMGATAPEADNGLSALDWALVNEPECAVALAPGLAQALAHRHPQRYAVWRQTEPLISPDLPAPVRARWLLGWAKFWYLNKPAITQPRAREAADLFQAEGHAPGEYRATAMLATVDGPTTPQAHTALLRLRALEDPSWPAELRHLRPYAEATHLYGDGRFDEARATVETCMDMLADGGRETRLTLAYALMHLEILAGRYEEAALRGLAARERTLARRRHAPASGVDLYIVMAWALHGDAARTRELAPGVWEAACRFDHQGPTAAVLSLLAALESRPRTAMLLLGFADRAYERTRVRALRSYQLAAEKAESLAAPALGHDRAQALRERGAALSDEAAGALAFSSTHAPA